MKRLSVFCAVMMSMTISISCNEEDPVNPRPSDQDLLLLTVEELQSNEKILEDAFSETAKLLTSARIAEALQIASTKVAFMDTLNEIVNGVFEAQIAKNPQLIAADVLHASGDLDNGDVYQMILETASSSAAVNPASAYGKTVAAIIDAGVASGKGPVKLIEKVKIDEQEETLATEQISLNYEEIKAMHESQMRVIDGVAGSVNSQTDEAIELDLLQQEIPEVAIALLLPAVQRIRAYNGTTASATTPYLNWLHTEVGPVINGGLNHDIIRRYHAAGCIAGLHFLMSDAYRNDSPDLASALLSRVRYKASLMFLMSDIWEKNQLAKQMLKRVKFNEGVLSAAFNRTAEVLTRKAVLDARDASATKDQFFLQMNELTKGIFDRELAERSQSFPSGVIVASGDLDGDGLKKSLQELLINNTKDPLSAYSNAIKTSIKSKPTTGTNAVFMIVTSVTDNGVDKEANMSVTPERLALLTDVKDLLLANKSDAEISQEINKLTITNHLPEPLMALILPAVQKARNYNSTLESADTPYLQWLHSMSPMLDGGLDRDKIKRYDAAGFLGAVSLIASDKYRGDNQDYASIFLLKARYHATLAMLWGDLWGR